MAFEFKIIEKENLHTVIPFLLKLNDGKISFEILEARFKDMCKQNYECAGIYHQNTLIGVCGLWYCTRHYSGKSVEVDHVYIDDAYRKQGLGSAFFKWIYNYTRLKGYESMELNTYVGNHESHKFYYNEGFKILGYHFLKKL